MLRITTIFAPIMKVYIMYNFHNTDAAFLAIRRSALNKWVWAMLASILPDFHIIHRCVPSYMQMNTSPADQAVYMPWLWLPLGLSPAARTFPFFHALGPIVLAWDWLLANRAGNRDKVYHSETSETTTKVWPSASIFSIFAEHIVSI
jgi:hypothetical protein